MSVLTGSRVKRWQSRRPEPAPSVVQRMLDGGFTVLCQDRGLVENLG